MSDEESDQEVGTIKIELLTRDRLLAALHW